MKVILTAFNRKLSSQPMDWPEDNKGRDIYLMLDMERPSVYVKDNGIKDFELATKQCRFEATGDYEYISGEYAEEYKLVGIN